MGSVDRDARARNWIQRIYLAATIDVFHGFEFAASLATLFRCVKTPTGKKENCIQIGNRFGNDSPSRPRCNTTKVSSHSLDLEPQYAQGDIITRAF